MSFSVRITQIHLCDLIQFHNISKIRNSPLQSHAVKLVLGWTIVLSGHSNSLWDVENIMWPNINGQDYPAGLLPGPGHQWRSPPPDCHTSPCNKAALSSSLHPSMTESDWAAYALWKSHSTPTNAPTAQDHHHVHDANQAAPARQGGGLSNAPTEICHPMRRTVQENLRLSLKAPWKP